LDFLPRIFYSGSFVVLILIEFLDVVGIN